MHEGLGYGWGNRTIAFIGLAFGLPAPLAIMIFGAKLSAKRNQAINRVLALSCALCYVQLGRLWLVTFLKSNPLVYTLSGIQNQESRLTCPMPVAELLTDLALSSEQWAIGSQYKRNWNHDCGQTTK